MNLFLPINYQLYNMYQTCLVIPARVKATSIFLLCFILGLFQASCWSKNKDNVALSDLDIGALSDVENYAETLSDDLKDQIASIQNKIVPNIRPASTQAAGSVTISTTQQEPHNQQISNQKVPNQEVLNQDHKSAKAYDQIKLILTDLYRIFYTLYKSSQIRLRNVNGITLEKYSFGVMKGHYISCFRNYNDQFMLKEERALYKAIKEYYREPIDEYINSDNGDFTIVEQSAQAGREKVKEALAGLLKNEEYVNKENKINNEEYIRVKNKR